MFDGTTRGSLSARWCKTGAGEWIALGVSVIALAALVTSFWQGHETRRHNRKPVLAHLSLSFSFAETATVPFGLILRNEGSGPAIIYEIEMFLGNHPYSIPNGHPWSKIWPDAGCHGNTFLYSMANVGAVMRPDETILLVTEEHGKPSFDQVSMFACALSHINLRIPYKSIYGEPGAVDLQESIGPWFYTPTLDPQREVVAL